MSEIESVPALSKLEDASPKDRVVEIMESSKHVLDETTDKFLDSSIADNPRYAAMVKGGSGLGTIEERGRILSNPDLLMDKVETRLYEVVDKSRDETEKAKSSAKNAQDVMEGKGFWQLGELVHSTSYYEGLSSILKDGLLCSELHGERAKNDTTPLEVDLSEIVHDVKTAKDAFINSMSTYSADRGGASSFLIKFRREVGSVDYGEESSGNLDESPSHRTLFVGIPSTEISGIQIAGEHTDASNIIDRIIENGQYIPVYDLDDNLLLSPQEFEQRTDSKISQDILEDSKELSGPQSEKLKVQLPRLARSLIRLASKSQSYEAQLTSDLTFSNKRYDRIARSRTDARELRANYDRKTGDSGEKPEKVSIDLDNNRQLHVWQRGNRTDLFVSSLDSPSQQVKEEDIPGIRRELSKAVLEHQQAYVAERQAKKARIKAIEEDDGRG